jgi:hypothetical protein
VSESFRDWLREREGRPGSDEDAEVTIWDEMDELHDQRAERRDPRWFPYDGNLERLVRERRARTKR